MRVETVPLTLVHRVFARLSERAGELLTPPPGLEFDYSKPEGEAALVDADSMSWRIFKNPVALFVGGVAAVILELAEPSVRSGVWDHSSFRKDAVTRLRRTGAAAMMTVYGPRTAAEKMIKGVVRAHEKIRGKTPSGVPYRANDPRLLNWVQATASYGFIEAYHRFVSPLSPEERSLAFGEGATAAELYGATNAPTSLSEWERLLDEMRPGLERSEIIFEFLDIVRRAPAMPWPLRTFQHLLVRAAVDIVPTDLQIGLGLRGLGLSPLGRRIVRVAGRIADRVPLLSAPPAQASIRMGLEADALYR
ncbi:MAG TPA: oxygenase MpaB family protein [Rhizobiaceae bacterium]|nr:oxygenase MpaB family protein [Rhizobiaceae bacterium]